MPPQPYIPPPPWWQTGWVALPIFAAAAGAGVGLAIWQERNAPPPFCPETVTPDGGLLADVDYLEARTADAPTDAELPMVILLHGRQSTPAQIANAAVALPKPARLIAPQGFVAGPEGQRSWFEGDGTSLVEEALDLATELESFVEAIQKCRPTRGKPLVAGYDEGALIAYALATDLPDQIEGAVGAAGPLPAGLGPVVAETHVVHGRDDAEVPFEPVGQAAAAMAGVGAPIHLHPMSGVGHGLRGALQLEWLQRILESLPPEPLPPPVEKPPQPPADLPDPRG